LRDWLLAAERNVACQAGAVPRGPSFTSLRRMVCSLMTSESGAQARAIWYILKTADCPVTGSTFSSSFFAVGGAGVSEQAVSMARRAMAGKMDGFSICTCVPILAMGARVRHAVHIRNAIFGGIMWAVDGGGMASKIWVRASTT